MARLSKVRHPAVAPEVVIILLTLVNKCNPPKSLTQSQPTVCVLEVSLHCKQVHQCVLIERHQHL